MKRTLLLEKGRRTEGHRAELLRLPRNPQALEGAGSTPEEGPQEFGVTVSQ